MSCMYVPNRGWKNRCFRSTEGIRVPIYAPVKHTERLATPSVGGVRKWQDKMIFKRDGWTVIVPAVDVREEVSSVQPGKQALDRQPFESSAQSVEGRQGKARDRVATFMSGGTVPLDFYS